MTDEIDFDVMNKVREELCSKCQDRYWEQCIGIHEFIKNVIACPKAKKLYLRKIGEKQ